MKNSKELFIAWLLHKELKMNTISIISVSVAVLGLIFSTIWNIINAKRATDKDYQNLIQLIKKESIEQGETKVLFEQMSNSLKQIVEDNKKINERIYNLTERISLLEHDKYGTENILKQIQSVDQKANLAHQRIDTIIHDLSLKEKNE